jgi:peptidoglycan hydrolase-like protein with peptidoglycan-binding domain
LYDTRAYNSVIPRAALHILHKKKKDHMKKTLSIVLSLLFVFSMAMAQTTVSTTPGSASATKSKLPRKPIFRANKDQIKQAQKIIRDRSFYAGEETGKLDVDTRAGLKKYQAAEGLKVTGTLNKVTLEKMAVVLTDKQRAM